MPHFRKMVVKGKFSNHVHKFLKHFKADVKIIPLQADGLDAIFAVFSFSSPKSSVLPGTGSRGCYKLAAEQGMGARASGRLCGSSSGCRFQLISNTPRPPDSQRAFDGDQATPSPPPTPRRVGQVLCLLSNRNHSLLAPNRLESVLKR